MNQAIALERRLASQQASPNLFNPCRQCQSAVPGCHTITCSVPGHSILPAHPDTQLWDYRPSSIQPDEAAEAAARQLRRLAHRIKARGIS